MADTKIQNEDIARAINAVSQNKFDEAESICLDVLKKIMTLMPIILLVV